VDLTRSLIGVPPTAHELGTASVVTIQVGLRKELVYYGTGRAGFSITRTSATLEDPDNQLTMHTCWYIQVAHLASVKRPPLPLVTRYLNPNDVQRLGPLDRIRDV